MTGWAEVRAQFPATSRCAYLNTAAGGPISLRARAAADAYYEAALHDGDAPWSEWLERVESVRGRVADLLGVRAAEVAFVGNASAGMNLVAGLVERARSAGGETATAAADGAGGIRVLAVRGDFPSVTLPWLQRRFTVDFVAPEHHGGACLEAFEHARHPETAVLALGLVHYRTGYRYPLADLATWCRERKILLAVDATQALGALCVDLARAPADFLVASGYKWLGAGYGVGVLVVRDRHLLPDHYPAVGWRSAADPYALLSDRLALEPAARALELGHPPLGPVFALGAALELLEQLGRARVQERVLALQAGVRRVATAAGLPPLELPAGAESGIVWLPCRGAAAVCERLATQGVVVSARGEGIRVATHLFNDETDVERLAGALARIGDAPLH